MFQLPIITCILPQVEQYVLETLPAAEGRCCPDLVRTGCRVPHEGRTLKVCSVVGYIVQSSSTCLI